MKNNNIGLARMVLAVGGTALTIGLFADLHKVSREQEIQKLESELLGIQVAINSPNGLSDQQKQNVQKVIDYLNSKQEEYRKGIDSRKKAIEDWWPLEYVRPGRYVTMLKEMID